MHHKAPVLVSSLIFIFNFVVTSIFLPQDRYEDVSNLDDSGKSSSKCPAESKSVQKRVVSFVSNLKSCFTSKKLGSVVSSIMLFSFVRRATSYTSIASYYQEMYGIESYQRGYLQSYQSLLQFLVQSYLVKLLLNFFGGERKGSCVAAGLLAVASFTELLSSFWLYISIICPIVSVSISLLDLALKTQLTQVTPKQSIGSVLAALDILQSIISVTVPFYRALLFRTFFSVGEKNTISSKYGDPSPYIWLKSSCLHWLLTYLLLSFLLPDVINKNRWDVLQRDRKIKTR